jgi:16S rRNA (uracil1498-N3)-methyltransferase
MVEPLFKQAFTETPSVGGVVTLTGDEAKHAIAVRRMRQGEAIQLTDGHGLRVRGAVADIEPKSLQVVVAEVVHEPVPELELTLVQALAKGDRDELAVQAATELGVQQVIPWQAERSISRWDSVKAAKGQARWQTICDEAAKQSLRAWHPRVLELATTGDLTARFAEFDRVFVLDPTAQVGLAAQPVAKGKIAIIVGPEGGIDETELLRFEAAGAVRVRLGASILRTSTAGIVALSILQTSLGMFG